MVHCTSSQSLIWCVGADNAIAGSLYLHVKYTKYFVHGFHHVNVGTWQEGWGRVKERSKRNRDVAFLDVTIVLSQIRKEAAVHPCCLFGEEGQPRRAYKRPSIPPNLDRSALCQRN